MMSRSIEKYSLMIRVDKGNGSFAIRGLSATRTTGGSAIGTIAHFYRRTAPITITGGYATQEYANARNKTNTQKFPALPF